jgi:hypothetical protein
MNNTSIAPCGVNCDLCLGFQREKNKCAGCIAVGSKPYHCTVCSIKTCSEKNGEESLLCNVCARFPCRRIKELDKRYTTRYGESNIENLNAIGKIGLDSFIKQEEIKWKCPQCGNLLCVHRERCLICDALNDKFPSTSRWSH